MRRGGRGKEKLKPSNLEPKGWERKINETIDLLQIKFEQRQLIQVLKARGARGNE